MACVLEVYFDGAKPYVDVRKFENKENDIKKTITQKMKAVNG